MEILEKTISNSDMCWDNTLENSPEKFSVVLNSKSLDELLTNRIKIPNKDPNDFKFLKEYVENLKNKMQNISLENINSLDIQDFFRKLSVVYNRKISPRCVSRDEISKTVAEEEKLQEKIANSTSAES